MWSPWASIGNKDKQVKKYREDDYKQKKDAKKKKKKRNVKDKNNKKKETKIYNIDKD